MVDGNDLYENIVGRDTGDQLRMILEEIGQGMALLTSEEQGFVVGVQANLDLGMPLTQANIATLLKIRNVMRQRAHLGSQSRG
jgi:hypothetical protein